MRENFIRSYRTVVTLLALVALFLLSGCQSEPAPAPELIDLAAMARNDDLTSLTSELSDPAAGDEAGNTPLHVAAGSGSYRTTLLLLSIDTDISAVNDAGETPLHLAASAGSYEIVKLLIDEGASPDEVDQAGNTPLHNAIRNDSAEVARILSDNGVSLLSENDQGERPLSLALGNDPLLDAMLRPARLNELGPSGDTLLIAATRLSRPGIVEALLARNADTEMEDTEGARAIDIALPAADDYKNARIAALLIDAGSQPRNPAFEYLVNPIRSKNLDGIGASGDPPLVTTVTSNHDGFLTWFLQQGANPDVPGVGGNTALHIAAQTGKADMASRLLSEGADAGRKNSDGRTPLHLVFGEGAQSIVPVFLTANLQPDVRNNQGETLLYHGVLANWPLETLRSLLQAGADAEADDNFRNTPLHAAVIEERPDVVALLLDEGASPLETNDDEQIPFVLALSSTPMIRDLFIVERFSDMSDDDGNGILHLAVKNSASPAVIEQIIEVGADPQKQNMVGRTAVHMAVENGRTDQLSILLGAGGNLFTKDIRGTTPILLAANTHPDVLVWMLEEKTDNGGFRDELGNTILHHLSEWGTVSAVNLALQSGATPSVRNGKGKTPLHLSVSRDNSDTVAALLRAGANPQSKDDLGNTPLHLIVANRQTDIGRALIRAGADTDARNSVGQTPLLVAVLSDGMMATTLLLNAGADARLTDENGSAPIHAAVRVGSEEKVALLTHYNMDLTVRDGDGDTPLHIALRKNEYEIAERLLFWNPTLFARNGRGKTPIEIMLGQGSEVVSRILTARIAALVDDTGNSIVHYAIDSTYPPEVLESVIRSGADLNVRNNQGISALGKSVDRANIDALRLLLENGADIHVPDNAGMTPLVKAIRAGTEMVRYFIEADAIAARDNYGNNALHIAVLNNGADVIPIMLEAGVDPSQKNVGGKTPLELARERNYTQAARMLGDA